jgi:hypothetical protein
MTMYSLRSSSVCGVEDKNFEYLRDWKNRGYQPAIYRSEWGVMNRIVEMVRRSRHSKGMPESYGVKITISCLFFSRRKGVQLPPCSRSVNAKHPCVIHFITAFCTTIKESAWHNLIASCWMLHGTIAIISNN